MNKKALIRKVVYRLAKGKDVEYSKHSTQINLEDCSSEKDYNFITLLKKIPRDVIYRELPQIQSSLGIQIDDPKEEYGIETTAHVTVLYGILKEEDYFDLRKKLSEIRPFEITIGDISSFRTPDKKYDVLKLTILSDKLNDLHNFIKKSYANDYSFPEYNAHMTLSYIKKNTCQDLEGPCFWTGTKYKVTRIRFSHKDGYYLDLPLGPKMNLKINNIVASVLKKISKKEDLNTTNLSQPLVSNPPYRGNLLEVSEKTHV